MILRHGSSRIFAKISLVTIRNSRKGKARVNSLFSTHSLVPIHRNEPCKGDESGGFAAGVVARAEPDIDNAEIVGSWLVDDAIYIPRPPPSLEISA